MLHLHLLFSITKNLWSCKRLKQQLLKLEHWKWSSNTRNECLGKQKRQLLEASFHWIKVVTSTSERTFTDDCFCVLESLNESLAACAAGYRCSLGKTLVVGRLTMSPGPWQSQNSRRVTARKGIRKDFLGVTEVSVLVFFILIVFLFCFLFS